MMLVTFYSNAYADITMFGDVAVSLLKMMGHSGSVPGALNADEVSDALARLRSALSEVVESLPEADNKDDDPPVSLGNRALPLIALLEAAERENTHVMWDR